MCNKFISGHRNYHVRGINSFLIRESKPGESRLLRVFQATDNCASKLIQYGDYSIAPHNHSFSLTLYLMFGAAYNVEFQSIVNDGNDYSYRLGVNGDGFNLEESTLCTLVVDQIRRIRADGIGMNSEVVHSIVAESGSVWLTVENESPIDFVEPLYLFSKLPNFSLVDPELYQPMSEGELSGYQYILDAAKNTMHREGIT